MLQTVLLRQHPVLGHEVLAGKGHELAVAGIMEPVPGSDTEYRFTVEGMAQREAILEREEERIERERYAPPDDDLSDPARGLLRRILSGERVEVDAANRPEFRELATARVIILGHTFTKGAESCYRLTYWGHKLGHELSACAKEIA